VQQAPGYPPHRPPETQAFGIASSTLVADKWSTRVSFSDFKGDPIAQDQDIGPTTNFRGTVYVRGSDDFNWDIAPKDAAFRKHVSENDAAFLTPGFAVSGTMTPADDDTTRALGKSEIFQAAIKIKSVDTSAGTFAGTVTLDKDTTVSLDGKINRFTGGIEYTFTPQVEPCTGTITADEGDSFEGRIVCKRIPMGVNTFVLHATKSAQ